MLKWENYYDIARALADKLKETDTDLDLINVSDSEIIHMVNSLDGFEDDAMPKDPEIIDAVIYLLIRLLDDDKYDDSRYDPFI